jgi:intein/homing endonuclease
MDRMEIKNPKNSAELTVWQRLSQAFGPNALLNQDYPVYKFDKKELLKTPSKQEYEKQLLQAQQTYYLANQWTKIESNLYTQAVYYEPTRLASFYDYESMEYCIVGDTKIATPDGFITIKELADKGRDYEFITYAYDHNIKKVVPAKARNAHYTRDEMTYKITFDDGSFIIATWEHQFMKRDGSFERVMNLKSGDSMMPFYRKSFYNNEKYNWIYTCNSNEGHNGWVSEHNMIAEWFYEIKINEDEEVHHIDFNGKNNIPENLQIMKINEHRAYHARLNNEKLWANPEYREKMSEVAKRKGKMSWGGRREGNQNPAYIKIGWDNIIETARKLKTLKGTAKELNVSYRKLQREIVNNGYKDWNTFLEAYGIKKSIYSTAKAKGDKIKLNHKIVSIEPYGIVPVYDLTVPGYKNFATDTIFSHNTPEISAALDIYGEESTTVDQNGYMLQIYSESKRIKSILADLFNNVLDINTNLPMWTRNTCKYGDNFVYLKLDSESGVVGCMQLPNIEIERLERGMAAKSANVEEPIENKGLRFKWKAKDMEFNSWEMAHFRLLGDDRKLPYGTCLKFDTKIDTEFGVKEIKDIQKGDLVWSFDLNTEQKVLSKVLDTVNSGVKTCYQIHTKHNFIEASKEHKILIYKNNEFVYKNVLDLEIGDYFVIDNTKGKVKEIIIDKSEPDENKNGWFNSVDLIPDFVNEEFARFFGFMIGDGWISNNGVYFALSEYDDLNDFYIGILNKYSKNPVKIIETDGKETQCMVWSKCLKTIMERMGFIGNAHTKRLPEWIYYSDIKIQKALLEGLIDADGWITQDKWSTHLNIELCNQDLVKDVKTLCQKIGYKSGSIRKREPRKNVMIEGRDIKSNNPSFSLTFYDTLLEQTRKHDNDKRKSQDYILEPINKIIEIGEFETHDIYVENENHNFYANGVVVHNSMLEKARRIWKQLLLSEDAMLIYRTSRAPERRVFKVFVGNMDDKDVEPYVQRVANKFKRSQVVDSQTGNVDMRFNQMAVDQDYFIPVRDPAQASPIETLPGAQNLSEIADIEYIQKKLLTALRVPKAFLGFEEPVGDGKNLSLMDIRFARTINRIQKSMVAELNKIAIIHLFLLGFEDELSNFSLSLTNPSSQADLLKLDIWKEKILLYKDAVTAVEGIAPVSVSYGKKHILGMSDEEIKLDLQQQRIERAVGAELTNTATIITHTGIFDNIDKLYGVKSGATEGTSSTPPPPPGGEEEGGGLEIPPPPPGEEGGGAVTPESVTKRDNLKILIENETLINGESFIDLSKARNSLGEIEDQLNKLLRD